MKPIAAAAASASEAAKAAESALKRKSSSDHLTKEKEKHIRYMTEHHASAGSQSFPWMGHNRGQPILPGLTGTYHLTSSFNQFNSFLIHLIR